MAENHTIESVEQAALQLKPDARLKLTRRLLSSLSSLSEEEMDSLWLDEAEQRDSEMESGQVAGIPGKEVFRRIRARFK